MSGEVAHRNRLGKHKSTRHPSESCGLRILGPFHEMPTFAGVTKTAQMKRAAVSRGPPKGPQGRRLTLAGLEPAVRLVDDIGAPATADHAVVPMTVLERLQRITDLHGETLPIYPKAAEKLALPMVRGAPSQPVGCCSAHMQRNRCSSVAILWIGGR